MALVTTTLGAAATATAKEITVASATSITPGRILLVDQEIMQVVQSYSSGVVVPVLRGRDGTVAAAHVISTNVNHGAASDFSVPAPQTAVGYPVAGRPVEIVSISATGTLTLPKPGSDMRVILNGTSVITLTIPVPTKDMDGTMLTIVSGGVAAHVPTFTSGLGGVGSGYTALTVAAGAKLCIIVVAVNGAWNIVSGPAWTGTVTKVTAGIA